MPRSTGSSALPARRPVTLSRTVLCRNTVRTSALKGGKNEMDLVKALSEQYVKAEAPQVEIGDTVRVSIKVKEGNRERIQAFDGTVIAKKHGGINETITVRRISYNVGCEKVFPIHSPNIESITTLRRGKVRRAKLYYLRDRVGKKAKVKEKI